jgi:hypothetical protein
VSNPPNRTEHYSYMANEHCRLAANGSFAETRDFHRMMMKNYSTLAGAVEAKKKARSPRLVTGHVTCTPRAVRPKDRGPSHPHPPQRAALGSFS